jgi:hypothetical protein
MNILRPISAFALALLLVACGQKQAQSSKDEVVDAKAPAAAQGQPSEVNFLFTQAAESLKKKDEVAAIASLQSLRATPNLTVDQFTAVQDMMAKAQVRLAQRAAAGDQQAQAALKMLQMNPR